MELRIPSEYQEVEYIENTGTQYIITNYVPKSDWTEVTWKAMFTVSQSGDSMLWGAWAGNATKKTWQCELYNHYNWYVACGAYRYGNITNMIIPIGEIFSGHIDNTLFTINNSSISPTETRNGENNMPLGIFCWNPNSGSKYINKGARIYELTFKENGIVSADFIPCYRKSDNEIGMYDTVSKTFYTNLGTGTFLKGSDVTRYIDNVSVVDTRRKIILNQPHVESASGDLVTFDTDMKGKLKECKVYFSPVQEGEGDPSPDNVRNIVGWNGVSVGLPSEYQEVEYVESTGEQWIKTNIPIQYPISISSDLMIGSKIVDQAIFCASYEVPQSSQKVRFGIGWYGGKMQNYFMTYYMLGETNSMPRSIKHHIEVSLDNNIQTANLNNIELETKSYTIDPSLLPIDSNKINFYIFAEGRIRTDGNEDILFKSNARIYNLTIRNNIQVIGNFIPCYRKSDNEIGMYDTVSKQFFTNQGTGTFLKGDDVSSIQASIDWTDDVGTVYGGYVDLVSGELVATHLAFVMDGVNHKVSTGAGVNTNNNMARGHAFMGKTGGLENVPLGKNNSGLYAVNKYIIHGMENGAGNTAVEGVYCGTGTPYIRVVVSADDLADVSGANAILNSINEWLTNNPVQICYTLAEPIHYQLPPQQILTLKGTNNVYSDTNGQTEIKYWKH